MKPRDPYNLARLFEYQSRESMKRNGKKCECEMHEMTVIVPTASMGNKRVTLNAHAAKHLSSCQHSEMARTCWETPKKSQRQRVSVEIEG